MDVNLSCVLLYCSSVLADTGITLLKALPSLWVVSHICHFHGTFLHYVLVLATAVSDSHDVALAHFVLSCLLSRLQQHELSCLLSGLFLQLC